MSAAQGSAQSDPVVRLTPDTETQSAQDYGRTVRFQRLQDEVIYLDPQSSLPPLDAPPPPEPTEEPAETEIVVPVSADGISTVFMIIALAVLGGIMAILVQSGLGGGAFRLETKDTQITGTGARKRINLATAPKELPGLEAVLRMQDRREALSALAWVVLDSMLTAKGILRQSSWTAREALRRLAGPEGPDPALARLVQDSEAVHFGDRPLSEEQFAEHAQVARGLLQGARA